MPRGAYSYVMASAAKGQEKLLQAPLGDTLYFAGRSGPIRRAKRNRAGALQSGLLAAGKFVRPSPAARFDRSLDFRTG